MFNLNFTLSDVWYQKAIYKKENFGKLIYFWAKEVDDIYASCKNVYVQTSWYEDAFQQIKETKPYYVTVKAKKWDGKKINTINGADIIEAIDHKGKIMFVYNSYLNTLVSKNCNIKCSKEHIMDYLGEYLFDFWSKGKIKRYKFNQKRKIFIRDYIFPYEIEGYKNKEWYIADRSQETCYDKEYDSFYRDKKYLLYNGKFCVDITVDDYSNITVNRTIIGKLPKADKRLKRYKIKLK